MTTPFHSHLAQWVKDESVKSVASRLGVSRQTVYNWLAGSTPKADVIARAAREYGVPVSELIK